MSELTDATDRYIADRVKPLSRDDEKRWRIVHLGECAEAFEAGWIAGQQSRTPGPATAKMLENKRKALEVFVLRGWNFSQFADLIEADRAFLAEWGIAINANAPADDRGGEAAAG